MLMPECCGSYGYIFPPMQELLCCGVSRHLDLVIVFFALNGDVLLGCQDYEREQPRGLPGRPGWQLQ